MKRASKIVQAGLIPSEGSWFQKTLARLAESVKWRRTDNLTGDGVEAIVARAEWAVKSQDISGAIRELSNLESRSALIAGQWLNNARAYVTVEKTLAEIQARVVTRMIDRH